MESDLFVCNPLFLMALFTQGGDVNEPVGINISEIYGSGNEGYGVEKVRKC